MSADCGKLKILIVSGAHKGDFPKFGHILFYTSWPN